MNVCSPACAVRPTPVGVVDPRVERDVVGGLQQHIGGRVGQQVGIDFTVGAGALAKADTSPSEAEGPDRNRE